MEQSSLGQRIGAAIRTRRVAKGMSQENFADLIAMHRAYYSAIERGQKNITISTLERIAQGLGTPMSTLLEKAGL